MPANTPTLVLFDIDGTLFYGHGCSREASRLAMLEVFGAVGNLDGHAFGGKTDWASLTMLLGPVGFDSAQIAAAIQRYDEALGRHLTAIIGQYPVEACPGGPELVEALHVRPGVVLGILTGNVPSTASIKLRTVGYDLDRFAVGAYGSEAPVRAGLPPIALSRAEKHYGQPFARVVIIGDTPDDVSCARSIGARTIAVTSGYGKRAEIEAEGPDVLLPDLRDTALVLDAIFSGAV